MVSVHDNPQCALAISTSRKPHVVCIERQSESPPRWQSLACVRFCYSGLGFRPHRTIRWLAGSARRNLLALVAAVARLFLLPPARGLPG